MVGSGSGGGGTSVSNSVAMGLKSKTMTICLIVNLTWMSPDFVYLIDLTRCKIFSERINYNPVLFVLQNIIGLRSG